MYITPQTNIRLLHNVPFDSSYVHSLFFADASGQTAYFQNLTKYNLNNYTYQRYDRGILRVQILADNLYDINYMMFQNRAFGNKWFYAFVDKVVYINDVTTAIYYHIDEIQTWLFDWNFAECFVERMHTPTDEIGDNIVPEPVETGEMVYNSYDALNKYHELAIILACVDIDTHSGALFTNGQIYDRIYSGASLFAYSNDSTGSSLINLKMLDFAKNPDSVVAMYMCPSDLLPSGCINSQVQIPFKQKATSIQEFVPPSSTAGTQIDGYTPRNKKLLTYPYNYFNLTDCNGNNLALRYEFFKDKIVNLNFYGSMVEPIQVVCCPTNYKNANNTVPSEPTHAPNYTDEKLTITNFPMCSWSYDSFSAWIAQNLAPTIINVASVGASVALATYNPATPAVAGTEVGTGIFGANGKEIMETVGGQEATPAGFNADKAVGAYALHNTTNLLTTTYKASIQADQLKGRISSGSANIVNNEIFKCGRQSVNQQQAQIIDNFFDRYGYSIHRLMTPSMHTRTNWTYVKTVDCAIHGSIPRDSEAIIENAFNNGITFWARPSVVTVGDYSQNNAPLT